MHIKFLRSLFICFLFVRCLQSDAQFVWRPKNCLAETHYLSVMFSLGNKGYIVGGSQGNNSYDANQVWEYDPVLNTFTQKNNFPRKISCAVGFVINDTAYVGLGVDSDFQYHSDFWKYDAGNDQWTQIADFPGPPRYQAMAFAANNLGFAGCGFDGVQLNDVYCYNPSTDSWTQVSNFPGGARQSGLGLSVGGFGYMGLGFNGNMNENDIYQYNPILNTWARIADFPGVQREGSGFFILADSFYMCGGGDYPVDIHYNDCWRYDPSTNTWAVQESFACVSPPFSNIGGFVLNGHGYVLNSFWGGASYGKTLLEFGPPDASFVEQLSVLGNDTSYCGSFSQTLITNDSCTVWSTGEVGPQIVVTTPGTYWATWPDTCGMLADTIVINRTNLPIGDSIQNATCGLSNGSAGIFVLSGISPYTYTWSNGDTTPVISNVAAGIYSVTVTDFSNCTASINVAINGIGANGVTIIADTTTFCAGSGTQVCAPAGFTSYNWNTGQTTACIFAQNAGNYYVTVSDGGTCSAESNHILLSTLPAPSVSLSVDGDTLRCYSGIAYQWYFNGTAIAGATADSLIARMAGDYAVLVTDTDGCSSESNGVPVFNAGILTIATNNNISIYPNPFSQGNVVLEVTDALLGSKAEIYDSKGSMVGGLSITSLKSNLDMPFESGVYIIRIIAGGNVYIRKLVKL